MLVLYPIYQLGMFGRRISHSIVVIKRRWGLGLVTGYMVPVTALTLSPPFACIQFFLYVLSVLFKVKECIFIYLFIPVYHGDGATHP